MANTVCNNFKGMLLEGHINGLTDSFKIILMQAGFVFDPDSDYTYADVSTSEVANGNGYTTGGQALTGVSIAINTAADTATISWNQAEWTVSGGTLTASGAIIFDDSTTLATHGHADAILSYIDFGDTQNAVAGQKLRIPNISITIN